MKNNEPKNQQSINKAQLDAVIELYSSGEYEKTIKHIKILTQDYPNIPILFNILGVCYKAQNMFMLSIEAFEKAVTLKPDYAEVHNNMGLTHLQMNNIEDAISSFNNATSLMPNFFGAYYNKAIALNLKGEVEGAIECYEKVITIKPNYAEAYNNLGTILMKLGRYKSAQENYQKSVEIRPNFIEAYNNLGVLLKNLNKYDDAVKNFKKARDINPNLIDTHYNLGTTFIEQDKINSAINSLKIALSINPNFAEAHNNLGTAYKKIGQMSDSIMSYKKAINTKENYAEAHNNLGLLMMNLGDMESAYEHLLIALKINPDYIYANNNFGSYLSKKGKFLESIEYFNKAISLNSNFFEAYSNLGNALKYLKRHDESLACYEKSYAINPKAEYSLGSIIHSKLHLSIWNDIDEKIIELREKINANEKSIVPFPLLALIDDPALHKKTAEIYIFDKFPPNNDLPKIRKYSDHPKIKIGYFSPDFRIHPVANLTAELYEIHDRNKFEVYAFSFGPDTKDEMNLRIKHGVDHFYDVRALTHKEVSVLSRELEIDIAIDLGGFTQDTRTEIFAMRAAPIQVNFLGYSSTMGAEYIDYIIADKTLIPTDKQKHYSESIAYLPNSFMVNDTKNKISKKVFTREDFGLPEFGFVFCCFNHHYKISPYVFKSWMRILSEVKGSVLWLSDGNQTGIKNLKLEAQKHGIDDNRLIFAPRLDLREDHLNRIKLGQLFLDTHPYNAHATTSDALQAGLPVLTYIGKSFASRVAASLINSVDLPELICNDFKEYEKIAIDLATDPLKFNSVKEKLERNISSSPLYNTPLFVENIESAYLEMYQRHHSGKKPEHIYVKQLN